MTLQDCISTRNITKMLIQLLISVVLAILTLLFGWLPKATVLPYGIDEHLQTGVGYVKGLTTYFPFLATITTAVLIYIGWRLLLLVANVFLGSRTPHHE